MNHPVLSDPKGQLPAPNEACLVMMLHQLFHLRAACCTRGSRSSWSSTRATRILSWGITAPRLHSYRWHPPLGA